MKFDSQRATTIPLKPLFKPNHYKCDPHTLTRTFDYQMLCIDIRSRPLSYIGLP